MNSTSHFIDFKRLNDNANVFVASEIFINRVKRSLAKEMRAEWNTLLSVEHLSKMQCWATLEELEKVIWLMYLN